MEIPFDLGGQPATFQRNPLTGRAGVSVEDETVTLASPFDPRTQFSLRTRKVWRHRIGGHEVEVVKVRPLLLGGARRNSYRILVDGEQVAAATGH